MTQDIARRVAQAIYESSLVASRCCPPLNAGYSCSRVVQQHSLLTLTELHRPGPCMSPARWSRRCSRPCGRLRAQRKLHTSTTETL